MGLDAVLWFRAVVHQVANLIDFVRLCWCRSIPAATARRRRFSSFWQRCIGLLICKMGVRGGGKPRTLRVRGGTLPLRSRIPISIFEVITLLAKREVLSLVLANVPHGVLSISGVETCDQLRYQMGMLTSLMHCGQAWARSLPLPLRRFQGAIA